MKRAISLFLALTLLPALAGCGHTHEWQEATCTEPRTCAADGATEGEPLGHDWRDAGCTEPKTCARCGETEGEALGHDWREATCAAPKTCARCGETEGEPLDHVLTEANYQDPATCTVCGETVGEPLTPDFVTYGLAADMAVGEHYDYETLCTDNRNVITVGDLTVLDYSVFESDGAHAPKDGYEWRVVTFQIVFSDDNAWNYGYSFWSPVENYYDVRLNENSVVYDGNTGTFTVNYHGEDMECKYFQELSDEEQGRANIVTAKECFQVPVGYDGCVAGVYSTAVVYPEGSYLPDIYDIYGPAAIRLFRLD